MHIRNTKRGTREGGFDKSTPACHPVPPRIATTFHFAPRGKTSIPPHFQGFQASLSAQPTLPCEQFKWSNRRAFKISHASYGHPMCNFNLFCLYSLSLSLPVFVCLFRFPHSRGHTPVAPSRMVLYQRVYRLFPKRGRVCYIPAPPQSLNDSKRQCLVRRCSSSS